MTYKGTVKGGVIVLEGDARLPEGAAVEVREVAAPVPAVSERYKGVIGAATGLLPKDMARNHDHYIHGTPKDGQ